MSPAQPRWSDGVRPLRKPAPHSWLTVAQAAEYSGFAVRTIRKKIAEGDLPAYIPRGSRVLRIDLRDLEDMMTSQGRVPSAHLADGGAAR
jgi:excisionase family DNA binding protein